MQLAVVTAWRERLWFASVTFNVMEAGVGSAARGAIGAVGTMGCSRLPWILALFMSVIAITDATPYNIHWIDDGSRIDQSAHVTSSPLNVYCYKGKPKYIIYLWQSVMLNIDIKNDNFYQYVGHTPDEVWNAFQTDKATWTVNFFASKKPRHLNLNPFNQTCFAINSVQSHTLSIEVKNVDHWRITFLIIGIVLFFWARSLGENTLFYYAIGVSIGICASFMVLVYILSRMLPGKPIVYGSMVGGWAVGIYFFQLIWSNFQPLLLVYRNYVIWYILISGFISFIVCYKKGPPSDRRSKNLIVWTLQILGFVAIYFSTEVLEAIIAIYTFLLLVKYVPRRWTNKIISYWAYKFPPKRVLLTQEQYYEEGIRETAKALEDLRGYCSSPECKQWELVRKLKYPSKFANFMDGSDHISSDEINDYDTEDFIIHRPKAKNPASVSSNLKEDCFTSDDSSFSPDDL
ncbi:nuclear envelope integral membrane protein [Arctopsyche grandis]|uniref:nuclear envelope integral membrane protein n=1 Tax=Arctopsyche grandis TaxID=121162 RepID=UPI00406D8D4A